MEKAVSVRTCVCVLYRLRCKKTEGQTLGETKKRVGVGDRDAREEEGRKRGERQEKRKRRETERQTESNAKRERGSRAGSVREERKMD